MAEPIQPVRTTDPSIDPPTVPLKTVVVIPDPPKKRRGPLVAVIIAVVVLALLVVGFFIADALVRQYANSYVRDRIVEVLKLDPKTPVDVTLGGGSIILQAISGSINSVDVHADSVTFGDITGSAEVTATHVPLDQGKPVGALGIKVTISEDNVKKLGANLSGMNLKTITLQDGVIRVGTDFTVLFLTLPVTVDLAPSAKAGGISFEPKVIKVGDSQFSVADLRANPIFGGLAATLLKSQDFCVASYLPAALKVTDVNVTGANLVVTINGDDVALSGPNLSKLGTCP
jgi:hypothetical protein